MEENEGMRDCREELLDQICLYMGSEGLDMGEAKNRLYVLMEPYEITSRCTQLAEMQQDRNEYLLKKFIIGKTVAGCTKRTIHVYIDVIGRTLQEIGKTVDDITADDIRYYIALKQQRDGISKGYADTVRRYMSTFFTYLTKEELVQKNPMLRISKIKCESKQKKAFTEIEIERLRMEARDERERAIFEFLLSTGCRVSEAVSVKLEDIKGEQILVRGKGEKDRYVYLNAKAQVAIDAYVKERSDSNPYLFAGGIFGADVSRKYKHSWWKYPKAVSPNEPLDIGTIRQTTQRMAKRAGVEQANPHKFRRTCATMALRHGMPIEQVSKMLGHAELSTTQIYLDLTEEELEQAHKKYVI